MKKLKSRILIQRIGFLAGLLFSIQVVSGQVTSDTNKSAQARQEHGTNDNIIAPEPAFYYLYACSSPEKNPQLNCIVVLENRNQFNARLLQLVAEENEEEDIRLEQWMLYPQTWLSKQLPEDE